MLGCLPRCAARSSAKLPRSFRGPASRTGAPRGVPARKSRYTPAELCCRSPANGGLAASLAAGAGCPNTATMCHHQSSGRPQTPASVRSLPPPAWWSWFAERTQVHSLSQTELACTRADYLAPRMLSWASQPPQCVPTNTPTSGRWPQSTCAGKTTPATRGCPGEGSCLPGSSG